MKNECCISHFTCAIAWAVLASFLSAQEEPCATIVPWQVFCDPFANGNAEDPVTWTSEWPGSYDATSGDYIISPTPETGPNSPMIATAMGHTLATTSILAQVRFDELGHSMGIEARRDSADQHGYWLAIQGVAPTKLILYRNESGFAGFQALGEHPIDFDVTQEDVLIQLDAIDDQLRGWIWRLGEPMPEMPQIEVRDGAFTEGTPALWTVTNDTGNGVGVFRWVQVTSVPEPSTTAMVWLGFTIVVLSQRAKRSRRHSA